MTFVAYRDLLLCWVISFFSHTFISSFSLWFAVLLVGNIMKVHKMQYFFTARALNMLSPVLHRKK